MTNSKPLRFLAIVEQSANFNYARLPRTRLTIEWSGALPSNRSRTTTLSALQNHITARLSKYLPSEGGRFLIWLLDDAGIPALFITGLIDQRNGKLTKRQLADKAANLHPQITCEQELTDLDIRVSATAELTFSEGSDFESTDYEGKGEDRDEDIAHDMVKDSCGHLDESCMSYVERDEEYLYVNAEVTEAVTVQVPWGHSKQLRPDQLEYLKVQADHELSKHVAADDVRFVNLTVELGELAVRTA